MTVYQGTSFTPELTAKGYALIRAGVKVSAGTCDDLAGSLRRRHERNGTRWRLLSPLAQAVLVIAFLRTNLTYAELAAGSGISPATCWRDVAEGISVLAGRGRRISPRGGGRRGLGKGGGAPLGGAGGRVRGEARGSRADAGRRVPPGRGAAGGARAAAGRDGGRHRGGEGGHPRHPHL